MGLLAQAGAAMPLPPAQAEAIYDLSLDVERDEILSSCSTDGADESVRQSRWVLVGSGSSSESTHVRQTDLFDVQVLTPVAGRSNP